MKPITRYERYLAYLGDDDDANGIDSPVTRIEQYLSKIAGQDVPIPEKPILRIEQYLAKIAGEDVAIPEKPISRVEMYLAAIAGEEIEVPEPITREEYYLSIWAAEGIGELKTVTGALLHITDALAKPAKKFVATLEPIQSGSGDPSPDNVRPITGHTGANVYRTGVNVWDEEWVGYAINTTTGQDSPSTKDRVSSKNYISVKPNTSYVIANNNTNFRVFFYAQDKTFISMNGDVLRNTPFTTPANCYFIRFSTWGGYGTTYNNDISVNYPSTDTSYHAYSGTTIPITFPDAAGTVYGGTLTNEGGEWKLKVTNEYIEFDGTESWSRSSTYNGSFYRNTGVAHKVPSVNSMCSHAKYLDTFPAGYSFGYWGFDGANKKNINIWIQQPNTSVDDFKAYLASQYANGTPLQFALELATPIEYDLTESQALTLLKGENNIWCDASDDLELKYLAEKI